MSRPPRSLAVYPQPELRTDNTRYAPSGNVLCSCPICGGPLQRLIQQHLAHTPDTWAPQPLDRPRAPSPSMPHPTFGYQAPREPSDPTGTPDS